MSEPERDQFGRNRRDNYDHHDNRPKRRDHRGGGQGPPKRNRGGHHHGYGGAPERYNEMPPPMRGGGGRRMQMQWAPPPPQGGAMMHPPPPRGGPPSVARNGLLCFRQWVIMCNTDTLPAAKAAEAFDAYLKTALKSELEGFFEAFKDKDFMKDMYLPENHDRLQQEHDRLLAARLAVFKAFMAEGKLDELQLDTEHMEEVTKVVLELNERLDVDPDEPRSIVPLPVDQASHIQIDVVRQDSGTHTHVPATTATAIAESAEPTESAAETETEPGETTDTPDDAADAAEPGAEALDFGEDEGALPATVENEIDTTKKTVLYCSIVPEQLSLVAITNALQTIPGFRRVDFSRPTDSKRKRMAWACFYGAPSVPTSVKVTKQGVYALFRSSDMAFNPVRGAPLVRDDDKALKHLVPLVDMFEQQLQPGDRDVVPEDEPNRLTKLVLYLRAVFMFDFFGNNEYTFEHNRCDRLHTLSIPKTGGETRADSDWEVKVQERLKQADEAEKLIEQLDLNDLEARKERFVQSHCIQMKENVWKCTLCNKLFRGPEFVIKHINNKHQDDIERDQMEAKYFANYIRDPRRPLFPVQPNPNHLRGRPHF
eukprot:TRINITY_DN9322_c0_g1_i5.p1 TRINITY_DN9322_c0_g1~~TRINITY_DN9322_c0_g1_i5.p1  ORF type:complete len:597 (+),score=171.86 TRINITY_DN9322_c0_g1_i5:56-1846(+)